MITFAYCLTKWRSLKLLLFIVFFSFAFTTMWIYLLGTPLVSTSIPIPYDRAVSYPVEGCAARFVFWSETREIEAKIISRKRGIFCLLCKRDESEIKLSREPRRRRPNALQVPLPRRLSWPCVSDLQSIYKAESWQRAVTLDDSTPQWRLCENRCGVSTSLLRWSHHRQVKLAVKT